MAVNLPHLPDVERFTLQGTNTYILGHGPKRILIDTAQGEAVWASSLRQVLADERCSIDQVILTHWHGDHTRGVPDLLKLCPDAKVYKSQLEKSEDLDITSGQVFRTEGATLRAFHCPGHTVDHVALILEEEDAMFTGDNVLGHGTAVFEDLATYMDSLGKMQQQFKGRAYPAHGAIIDDGPAKIREYIGHRSEREQQVLNVLKDGAKTTSMGIVKVVYKNYPESLHAPAEGGVKQILAKLEGEGKVAKQGDEWQIAGKAAL